MTQIRGGRKVLKHSPIHEYLRQNLDEEFYTYAEAAPLIGRHQDTVKKWVKRGRIDPPSYEAVVGDLVIHLFTPEDIQRFRRYAKTVRPGRPTDEYKKRLDEAGSAD